MNESMGKNCFIAFKNITDTYVLPAIYISILLRTSPLCVLASQELQQYLKLKTNGITILELLKMKLSQLENWSFTGSKY